MAAIHNIGIVAHVDAGKTTTTEHILYRSGQIRVLGRVDAGTAHTDWLEVERQRGISVRAAVTHFGWRDHSINLIDTPGHVDFSAEVERALSVLDSVVLVISAIDGVQSHTEALWQALKSMRIPTLIFVNKMDRVGVNLDDVLGQLQALDPNIIPIQAVDGFGSEFSQVIPWTALFHNEQALSGASTFNTLFAKLAEASEHLFEQYALGVEPDPIEIASELVLQVHASQVYPVLFGAALKGIGVTELMDAMIELLPVASGNAEADPSGLVFKVERDATHGRVAYIRLFEGTLKNRDEVLNVTRGLAEKVTQIRRIDVQSSSDSRELSAGDVAAVYGLRQARVGDILGRPGPWARSHNLSVPLFTVQVIPDREQDIIALAECLQELDAEDPALALQWIPNERELHVQVMGAIQLEVLAQFIADRFGLSVTFGPPTVIYKETPLQRAEGFVAYTMPKPCWAILRFDIQPGPRGSGLQYASTVRQENLLQAYQSEVARRVPEALQQGVYGWEVTDLQVTLIEGEHHVWHTHPLDFVVATPMAIMDGLRNAGTQLLEPVLTFRLSIPDEYGGRVMSELVTMRGEYETPSSQRDRLVLEGTIPLATSIDYPLQLAKLTGGRAIFSTRFLGYRPCPTGISAVRKRRGINPLDTAKYILAARSALSW